MKRSTLVATNGLFRELRAAHRRTEEERDAILATAACFLMAAFTRDDGTQFTPQEAIDEVLRKASSAVQDYDAEWTGPGFCVFQSCLKAVREMPR